MEEALSLFFGGFMAVFMVHRVIHHLNYKLPKNYKKKSNSRRLKNNLPNRKRGHSGPGDSNDDYDDDEFHPNEESNNNNSYNEDEQKAEDESQLTQFLYRPIPSEVLSLDSLMRLAKSENVQLQDRAIRILIDRSVSDKYLKDILKACQDRINKEMSRKAISAIEQITKDVDARIILIERGVHRLLCRLLNRSQDESASRPIVVSLFRLLSTTGIDEDQLKLEMIDEGILDVLISFLKSAPTHSSDLKYWSLFLLHQFSLSDSCQSHLIQNDVVLLLSDVARLTFGNTNMQKLCMHSLVRLVSSLNTEDSKLQLKRLLDAKIISIIASCLKNDDLELVSWSVFLVHEFVIKDLARTEFAEVKGILKILLSLIQPDESSIARIIIKTLKCIGINHPTFQKSMIKEELMKKLVQCLRTEEEEETQYWALALLHDLMAFNESHSIFLKVDGLKALIALCEKTSIHFLIYIADILVYICTNTENFEILSEKNVAKAIMFLCKSDDYDIQYAVATLALNLITLSNKIGSQLHQLGIIPTISDFVFEYEKSSLQTVSSKTLITLARRDPDYTKEIVKEAIQPMMAKMVRRINAFVRYIVKEPADPTCSRSRSVSPSPSQKFDSSSHIRSPSSTNSPIDPWDLIPSQASSLKTAGHSSSMFGLSGTSSYAKIRDSAKSLSSFLECFNLFFRKNVQAKEYRVDFGADDAINFFMDEFVLLLLDLIVLPLLMNNIEEKPYALEEQPEVVQTIYSHGRLPSGRKMTRDKPDSFMSEEIIGWRNTVIAQSISLIPFLAIYKSVFDALIDNGYIDMLMAIFNPDESNIAYNILESMVFLHDQGYPLQKAKHNSQFISYLHRIAREKSTLQFFAVTLLEKFCEDESVVKSIYAEREHALFKIRTPDLLISSQRIRINSRAWTFESLRTSTGVTGSGRFFYEIELGSKGIIQIGWANGKCIFDPEGGTGVGDDLDSYSYDGYRQKAWHGPSADEAKKYGVEWKEGDIVTTIIDLNQRTISYWTNGEDHGIAFENIDSAQEWFPALSIACDQSCEIRLGGPLDRSKLTVPDAQSFYQFLTEKDSINTSPSSTQSSEVEMEITEIPPIQFIPESSLESFSKSNTLFHVELKIMKNNDSKLNIINEDNPNDDIKSLLTACGIEDVLENRVILASDDCCSYIVISEQNVSTLDIFLAIRNFNATDDTEPSPTLSRVIQKIDGVIRNNDVIGFGTLAESNGQAFISINGKHQEIPMNFGHRAIMPFVKGISYFALDIQ